MAEVESQNMNMQYFNDTLLLFSIHATDRYLLASAAASLGDVIQMSVPTKTSFLSFTTYATRACHCLFCQRPGD